MDVALVLEAGVLDDEDEELEIVAEGELDVLLMNVEFGYGVMVELVELKDVGIATSVVVVFAEGVGSTL